LIKAKCEKAEREKSDVLLRRLASLDTTPTSRTTASEVKIKYYKTKKNFNNINYDSC